MTPAVDEATLIDRMARSIRQLFVLHYRTYKFATEGVESSWGSRPIPQWDGGSSGDADYQPIWPKIARKCVDEGIEPAGFVAAQFTPIDPNSKPPRPNVLLGDLAVAKYRRHAEEAPERLRKARAADEEAFKLEVRWRVLDSGLATPAAARAVLRDRSVGLSAIYRYCMATQAGEAEIAAKFRDDAAAQYVFQRAAYDAVWGDFIPESLRAASGGFLKPTK